VQGVINTLRSNLEAEKEKAAAYSKDYTEAKRSLVMHIFQLHIFHFSRQACAS
jgi:hypothetical protein